jgi:TPR repeat protein
LLLAAPSGALALLEPLDEARHQEEEFKATLIDAERGDARGQYCLGVMYANGNGVAQDHSQARKWYLKAAEQGHVAAQYNLALMYDLGQGGAQDYVQARLWFSKAAEQGDADAQFNLGIMYAKGQGGAQDYDEAHAWYLKAAEQGLGKTKFFVGIMCAQGRGDRDTCMQALKRSVMGTARGVRYVTQLRDWMAAQVMVALFNTVKAVAAEWQSKPAGNNNAPEKRVDAPQH